MKKAIKTKGKSCKSKKPMASKKKYGKTKYKK